MNDLYNSIFDLPPRSITLIATLLGFILVDDLKGQQQVALGNFFILIGQTLVTDGAFQLLAEGKNLL